MARPRIKIDWDQFDKLAALQCTLKDIAGWFNCSEDTIELACKREKKMRFTEYYNKKRSSGLVSLRRKQYEKAMEGNVVMLIWLGKQYLGQSEKVDHNPENKSDAIIPLAYVPMSKRKSKDG